MNQPIRDDDMVSVPRGLLAAARYAIRNKMASPNVYAKLGDYALRNGAPAMDVQDVLDEELATVTADRDIKAANLQLLVDKVLADPDCLWAEHEMAAEANAMWDEIVELARGLKQ